MTKSEKVYNRFVLGVICPMCSAAVGKKCKDIFGRSRPFHTARLSIAQRVSR